MAKKPQNLIYGLEDKPPSLVLMVLTIQHVFLMTSTLALPIVLITEIGGSYNEVCSVVSMTMIACGIGTILQAARCWIIGSGYVCPNLCGPNFFMLSTEAAWLGGLPLMRGITILAGLVEIVFSRIIGKLKSLFPTEITGLVVFMVGTSIIPLGVTQFIGVNFEGEPISVSCIIISVITLSVMIGVSVYSNGKLKLYSVLLGMITGYLLSLATGVMHIELLRNALNSPWFYIPSMNKIFNITFNWSLVPVAIIVSITGALKSLGNLIMCEKINDDEWKEPDMKNISNGLVADSLCVVASGLLGGMASDTSASNVSLCKASGATSRSIAYAAGSVFIILGFLPKVSGILSIMPMPVMGAILIYVVSLMLISGIQIIVDSGIDTRKTFVIGIPLIFGLAFDYLPSLSSSIPDMIRSILDSSLTLCTILAVIINLILKKNITGIFSRAKFPKKR